jgi:hypothetical protein
VDIELVAKIAHEVDRALCAARGDHVNTSWHQTPEERRAGLTERVRLHRAHGDAPSLSPGHDVFRAIVHAAFGMPSVMYEAPAADLQMDAHEEPEPETPVVVVAPASGPAVLIATATAGESKAAT